MILSPLTIQKYFDNNGQPANKYRIFTYLAGTSTKTATYTDSTGGSSNTNPIVLNARGEANVWLDPTISYKFVFTYPGSDDPPASSISTVDNIPGGYSGTIDWTKIIYDQTSAEAAASVTPTNYFYAPDPNIDPRRYNSSIGTAANDLASINTAITVLKTGRGGTITVPANYAASMTLPSLSLSNNQAITIIDLRTDAANAFGVHLVYAEARDNSGGSASELRIQGIRNPNFTFQPLGTDNMGGFVGFTNGRLNCTQYLQDPLGKAYVGDFGFVQYAQGTNNAFVSLYAGVDANNKTRFDLSPSRIANSTINISGVTNTTPIVVNLVSNHGIVAAKSQVSIAGVGTGVNGSWVASITGVAQLTLLNSVASGAFGAGGTATVYPNSMRATLNVPVVQGGTESLVAEGFLVAVTGLKIGQVTNGKMGVSAAMVAGTVTVNNTSVTGSSVIFLTRQPGGVNPGAVYVSAQTASTSFVITSTNAGDTGTVAWIIYEPA